MKNNQLEKNMLASESFAFSNFSSSKSHRSQDGLNCSVDVNVHGIEVTVVGVIPGSALVPVGETASVFMEWCKNSLSVDNYSSSHQTIDLGSLTTEQATEFRKAQ